mmetsp:Transcript_1308/g.2484  ORF Transcript_1308/g.2484 Transcript_1308/m.2484 type:complete len:206 (-) Transcript_1308:816-1433(-)
MEKPQCRGYAPDDSCCLLFVEHILLHDALQYVTSTENLHNQADGLLSFDDFVESADARMGYLEHNLNFGVEVGLSTLGELLAFDELARVLVAVLDVLYRQYFAKRALTQLLLYDVLLLNQGKWVGVPLRVRRVHPRGLQELDSFLRAVLVTVRCGVTVRLISERVVSTDLQEVLYRLGIVCTRGKMQSCLASEVEFVYIGFGFDE